MQGPIDTVRHMHVTAFSSPREPRWRWRITDINGEVIEESQNRFDIISAAVTAGAERLVSINDPSLMRPRPGGTRHDMRGQHI
jgi:hypothetical protein